ncbi:hypothetical protein DNU06_08080 [Putridiphycobacter roseus]|uniref:Uncharacterized protein n=1 Tax=Putridiphycobacter roseus TaxID=2219161 RepID=A0A2W1NNK3_9FLAO|nr:hypothetical protein [Putridiphycobacter roseus]PZE17222.1 hypothetical protein DNU06_08080 [Putridiphycobacter roseus]
MKNFQHLFASLLVLSITSCRSENKADITPVLPAEISIQIPSDTTALIPAEENTKTTENKVRKVKSSVRANSLVSLKEIYIDSIEFIGYNDDFDYFLLTGKKNKRAIDFFYDWQWKKNGAYDFKSGDIIEVKWKMDTFWVAGDGERADFHEWVIDAKKLNKN